MKFFLTMVTIWCFTFSTIAGASIHSLIEAKIEMEKSKVIAVTYFSMPMSILTEVSI